MIIIDLIIIGIIVASFINGYKKGLVNIITTLVGFVLALILAFAFAGSVATYVRESTPFYNEIKSSVSSTLKVMISDKDETENSEEIEETEESEQTGMLDKVRDELSNVAEEKKEEKINEYTEKISMYVLKALSFMIIYILVITIASILNLMLNGIFSLPILDSVNKISGMLSNGIVTILKIQIILAVIYLISGISIVSGLIDVIHKTTFLNVLFNNNILVVLIENLFK